MTMTKATLLHDPPGFPDERKERIQESMREAKVRYLMAFDADRPLREHEPEWLQARRASAISTFERLGFPTTRHENWKYTNIVKAANIVTEPDFELSSEAKSTFDDAEQFYLNAGDEFRITFLDGHLAPQFSTLGDLPEGILVSGISEAISSQSDLLQKHLARYASTEDNPFVALNTALFHDGAFIHLRKNVEIEKPIHLLFISTKPMMAAKVRNLVILDENSSAHVVESYVTAGKDTYLTNAVTEIVAAESARLDHYKEQLESIESYHLGTTQIQAADNAVVLSHTFMFGGSIARHDANAVMDGEHIEVTLNGLYLGSESQLLDNHTLMDHAKPNCRSFEEYVGVLDDSATGVFNGKIYVRKDAQKTDAIQNNSALLLSRKSEINTKPQLEIFADDVKCTHGATIGELDEEASFYLQSRGIPKDEARDILIYAFAHAVLDNVKIPSLSDRLEREIMKRLRS